jgi:hypothetical protein
MFKNKSETHLLDSIVNGKHNENGLSQVTENHLDGSELQLTIISLSD